MDKIYVLDYCGDTLTNHAGLTLFIAMKEAVESSSTLNLSFKGVGGISSSFLNSAFASLVDNYGKDALRFIKPTDLTKVQAEYLKNYISKLDKVVH